MNNALPEHWEQISYPETAMRAEYTNQTLILIRGDNESGTPGITQFVKNAPNSVNPSYGPLTYRLEVEGMVQREDVECFLYVREYNNAGTLLRDLIWPGPQIPHGKFENISIDFTAPTWTETEAERVENWRVGVLFRLPKSWIQRLAAKNLPPGGARLHFG